MTHSPTTTQQRAQDFADKVRGGATMIGTFISCGSPLITEICAMAGFEWLLIDLEHGAGAEANLIGMLHAAGNHGVPAVVRAETTDRIRGGRALDLGADGIMLPRIDTEDEARTAVTNLLYPPAGRRGVASYNRARGFGTDTRSPAEVDDSTLTVVQIESVEAIRDVEAIAALPGVDALFVGPGDLTTALGVPGQIDAPIYLDALATTVEAARAQGISVGILASNADAAVRYAESGFNLVAVGSDATILLGAGRAISSAFRNR